MQTANKADENFKKLAELFPNAVTETIDENGEVVRAIDKDVLMQEISCKVVDGNEERYQFTWPDKKKSVLLANAPISKTLRPCREESVDFDNTENLYIEGDNLEVLKLLQETYLGKIKMIYIDPPYNTGNDFVYNDEFGMRNSEWDEVSGNFDADGNQIVGKLEKNTEANGRFHTDWLNMIYPRLKLAKDLLSDDGVIFISIDDNEVENLRKIADEIFGNQNFLGCFLWRKKSTSTNVANAQVSSQVDYQLCYCRNSNSDNIALNRRKFSAAERDYPFSDEKGKYRTTIIEKKDSGTYARATMKYNILGQTPREGKRWQIGEETARKYEKENKFIIENGIVKLKIYDFEEHDTFSANPNLLLDFGSTDSASKEVNIGLFEKPEFFSNPKPTELIKHLLTMGTHNNSLILDFFSGSATTAHAVMQLNVEDGGNRKFIMVQLPEETDEKSEAYKAGYKNICEIGKERIRRAGIKIRNEKLGIRNENEQLSLDEDNSSFLITNSSLGNASSLDTGFRVLKLDSSNMKDVYYTPDEFDVSLFDTVADNIKEDRTPEDLLFQVMLDLGIVLSSKIEETTVAGKKVFNVADGFLIACFDSELTDETITEIAKMKPYYFVMRDSSMGSDSVATNFDQIFETYSPDTVRKVL